VFGFHITTISLFHGLASFKILLASLAFSLVRKCKDYDLQKCNLNFALCGCITWSLISKEQRRLSVFMSEVQGMILSLRGKK
jgi:hypothetical protein